jgi:hypothetical protein
MVVDACGVRRVVERAKGWRCVGSSVLWRVSSLVERGRGARVMVLAMRKCGLSM